jgi:hypothetical protein
LFALRESTLFLELWRAKGREMNAAHAPGMVRRLSDLA